MLHLVIDALTFRLHNRPKLEVLDSIVGPHAVAMMNELVRSKGPLQEHSHHQSVFRRARITSGKPSQTHRHRNDSIPVVDVSDALDFPNGDLCQHVTVISQTVKMGVA